MITIIVLAVLFVLFQMFGTNEKKGRSIAEVEAWLKTLPETSTENVHRYDTLGPFDG